MDLYLLVTIKSLLLSAGRLESGGRLNEQSVVSRQFYDLKVYICSN
jgi:hypothetical protein